MSLLQRSMILVTAVLCLSVIYVSADADVDANCLGCMCEAATRCNATTACHHSGGGYFCGPFHISWAYWADAKKPVLLHDDPNRQGAFEDCAKDLYCSASVVRTYMKTFAQKTEKGDCNGDGKIDCIDFAYMHRLGGYSCKDASFTKTAFYERFMTCWKVVQEAMPQTTTSSSNSSSIS
ncbi:lysozyme-like isoform X1 [Portunus trituberculatus]|uniref:lysozyme-like isoform X1 n=1 Tax=Portunus trituberculatus TaxID=210409 RepID=UPI001E1CC4CD|nr:lysozyme-like isoform X1 [Portunus trituberculatus]